ncbi:MAG: VCBS repeat-containing protein, partial [Pyrinomonadaceae bacterium]
AQADSNLFRIFSTVVGTGANPPTAAGTTRKVWQTAITVSPALVLTAGNYWIDWNTQIGATTAHFSPSVSYRGVRGVPGWNARQFTGAAWANVVDAGQAPTGAPPLPAPPAQDFPFKLDGSIAIVGPDNIPTSRKMDFNGDNKSDFVVARAADVNSAATWYTLNSAGVSSAQPWGTGVGFTSTGGDVATPEDFDGDGKTDIAVWRRGGNGDPNKSIFFILQSSTGTLRAEQFGKQGDDPTVVDDYDGDGKADVAVFRANTGAGDPCGGSAVWYWRPSGTPATNFSYSCWGSSTDKAYPGDFDGDKKADFSVVRNVGGQATVIQNLTVSGSRSVAFGAFSDYYLSGDFDADGKQDIASVRAAGPNLTWYYTASGTGQFFTFVQGDSVTDLVVPGDYDGDNKTDFALWRSGSGAGSGDFILLKTASSPSEFKWGNSTTGLTSPDYPVANYQVH